jgi:hypothetical protein
MVSEVVAIGVEAGEPVIPLCVAQSRSNKRIFFLLVGVTCCASFFFDVLLFRRLGTFTAVFAFVTIWQALRTYVVRTVFTTDRIEHRNALGNWRGVKYSKIMVQEDRDESITIIGEDFMGRSVRFSLLKRDGNLEEVAAFLRGKMAGGPSIRSKALSSTI